MGKWSPPQFFSAAFRDRGVWQLSDPVSGTAGAWHPGHLSAFPGRRKEVQARAVFYPLLGSGSAVNMCYRTLYIGTGKEGLVLCVAGRCGWSAAVGKEHLRSFAAPRGAFLGLPLAPSLGEPPCRRRLIHDLRTRNAEVSNPRPDPVVETPGLRF